MNHKGHIASIPDINQHTKCRQHLAWTKNKINREGYHVESLKLTRDAIKDWSDLNKTIKLQSLAVATRAQVHVNQQFSNRPTKLSHQQLKMYQLPTCTFCDLDKPETTIHLIGKYPHWEQHRQETQQEIANILAEVGFDCPDSLILRAHHDYYHIHAGKNKKTWKHMPEIYCSIGRIPHNELLEAMSYIRKDQLLNY